MSDLAEIRLPHGTKYVTVEDIPLLIANALHPEFPTMDAEANALSRASTEEEQRAHLRKVIRAGELRAFSPGMTPYQPSQGDAPFARVLIDDLAQYLEKEIRIVRVAVEPLDADTARDSHLVDTHVSTSLELDDEAFQDDYGDDDFIRAQESSGTTIAPAVSRQRWQENEILRVIEELGYRPLALPKNDPGKKGVRDAAYTRCVAINPSPWIGSVFDKAWSRLSTQKRIQYSV
jgi:hypothetical protein